MVMKKRGDVSTSALIGITLLVIVSVILISFVGYFFFKSDLTGIVGDLACERSIQDRATYNVGSVVEPGRNLIPLNCETKQVCFSKGGKCEDVFGKLSKDNPVLIKTIPSSRTAKEEIMDYIAESLKKYHSILGRGKLDFMPHKTNLETSCPIYSWIVLDEDIRDDVEDISYPELYKYMQGKKMEDGTSYLSFVYPGWNSAGIVTSKLFEEVQKNDKFKNKNIDDWKIDLSSRNGHVIVAKMVTPGRWGQYATTAGVVGVVGVVTGASILSVFSGGVSLAAIPIAIGVLSAGTSGAAVLGGIAYVATTPGGSKYYSPAVYPYDVDSLVEMECTDFSVTP